MRINPLRIIPDSFTCGNIVCGTLAIAAVLSGHFDQAFYLILGACVFDYCDGLVARALGIVSDIGKELDSLCDLVSFGVLPSMTLFAVMTCQFGLEWFTFIPLVIAPFSAVRLAKFNLDTRQTMSFLGLATPACAMICCSLACFISAEPESGISILCHGKWFLPALSIALSALLISEIPMFAMKFKKGVQTPKATKVTRVIFLVVVAAAVAYTAIAGHNWSLAVALSMVGYILVNLFAIPFTRTR